EMSMRMCRYHSLFFAIAWLGICSSAYAQERGSGGPHYRVCTSDLGLDSVEHEPYRGITDFLRPVVARQSPNIISEFITASSPNAPVLLGEEIHQRLRDVNQNNEECTFYTLANGEKVRLPDFLSVAEDRMKGGIVFYLRTPLRTTEYWRDK